MTASDQRYDFFLSSRGSVAAVAREVEAGKSLSLAGVATMSYRIMTIVILGSLPFNDRPHWRTV